MRNDKPDSPASADNKKTPEHSPPPCSTYLAPRLFKQTPSKDPKGQLRRIFIKLAIAGESTQEEIWPLLLGLPQKKEHLKKVCIQLSTYQTLQGYLENALLQQCDPKAQADPEIKELARRWVILVFANNSELTSSYAFKEVLNATAFKNGVERYQELQKFLQSSAEHYADFYLCCKELHTAVKTKQGTSKKMRLFYDTVTKLLDITTPLGPHDPPEKRTNSLERLVTFAKRLDKDASGERLTVLDLLFPEDYFKTMMEPTTRDDMLEWIADFHLSLSDEISQTCQGTKKELNEAGSKKLHTSIAMTFLIQRYRDVLNTKDEGIAPSPKAPR